MPLRKLAAGKASVATAFAVVLLAGAIVLAGGLGPSVHPVGATGTDDDRLITVTGTGTITVEPDLCRLTVGVQTEGATAAAAEKANNAAADTTIAKILALGVKRSDVKTTGFNVHPVYDYSRTPETDKLNPIGFRCVHTLQVTVRDLTKVGELIDQAVAAGANTVTEVHYTVNETSELREQALKQAVQQARSKADAIAGAVDARVVGIKSIQEYGVDFSTYRSPAAYDEAAGAVPVMPGEISIQARVTMVVRF